MAYVLDFYFYSIMQDVKETKTHENGQDAIAGSCSILQTLEFGSATRQMKLKSPQEKSRQQFGYRLERS